MALTLDDQSYYFGFWLVEWEKGNALFVMKRPLDQAKSWIVPYRFRHFRSTKVWESDDEFSSYKMTPPVDAPADEVRRSLDGVTQLLAKEAHGKVGFTEVQGDVLALMAAMREHPSFSFQIGKVKS